MILTIDGPAGAGKSSVARQLAERLGFQFLDTGAMYRAVTWAAIDRGVDLRNDDALARLTAQLRIELPEDRVLVDDLDVSEVIRQQHVTMKVAAIADSRAVRSLMVDAQREIAATGDYVCEGRDQGTVAFPNAFCKIFLTASPAQRARRRMVQLQAAGHEAEFEQVMQDQMLRDRQDEARPVGGLAKASDAVEVNTDDKTQKEVVDELEQIARSRMAQQAV